MQLDFVLYLFRLTELLWYKYMEKKINEKNDHHIGYKASDLLDFMRVLK